MFHPNRFRAALFAAALLTLAFAPRAATAQSLADVIPATAVLYIRDEDPIGRFEKLSGSSDVWSNPKRVNDRTKRTMDKAFKAGDKQLERDEGTLDGWLRSIGSIEIALFSLSFDRDAGEFFPTIDYVASFESPAAIEMFGAMGKMMIDQGVATKTERGDYVLGFGMGQSAVLGIHGSRIIMAGTEDRMTAVVNGLKSGTPSPLSADPTFRACTGESASPSLLFVRFGALMQLIRDNVPERIQKRMTEVMTPLGIMKITGIGYREEGPNGIVVAKASEPIAAFKLLKGKNGPPGILEKMPADCAFAIGRTEEIGPHLQRIQKFLLDPATFPFAKEVGEGIDSLASSTGIKLDQVLAPLKGGVVFAAVPDDAGKIDDERSMVVVGKVGTKEEALALFAQMSQGMKGAGSEMEQTESNGQLWLRAKTPDSRAAAAPVESQPSDPTDSRAARAAARRARRAAADRERPKPIAVWTGEIVVAGMEPAVKRTLLAQSGQAPTLGTSGAFKRLAPSATFYMTSSFRSLFASENDFAAAFSLLKDFGNTGTSIIVDDDMMTVISNRTTAEQISTMIAAAALGEDGGDERGAIIEKLTEIGTRTKAYREKNKKWPASLADLGYGPKDMPSAKDLDGKDHTIVFLPPKEGADPDDFRGLLAYFPSSDYGRLAVSIAGSAWRWSESDFITALAKYNTPAK
jgi:hypothetical protein